MSHHGSLNYDDNLHDEEIKKENKLRERAKKNNSSQKSKPTETEKSKIDIMRFWRDHPSERSDILFKLGIPRMSKFIEDKNLKKIIIKEMLELIFALTNRKLRTDNEVLENLKGFKHAYIFAKFPISEEKLKDIPRELIPAINATMEWLIDKFGVFKENKKIVCKDPLKAYKLGRERIPKCSATYAQTMERLIEKRDLLKKLGVNYKTTTHYNMSLERIKDLHTETEKTAENTSPEIIGNENIEESEEFTITISSNSLSVLMKELKKLNGNIENLQKLFESFSEKF